MKQPLLSICIPTYKRPEILRNTLKSIYSQNVDHNLFEVCISDDSPTDETKLMIDAEFSELDNLIYKKTPECGFLNLFEALRLGSGCLLKLLNDYASLREGALEKIIALVERNAETEPLIFFGLNALKHCKNTIEFHCYNDFLKLIDYQCTFCSAANIWKKDFDRIISEGIEINHAFPHTTLLFKQSYKTDFIVDNSDYICNQPINKKGGYNLPDYFVKEYLTMIQQSLLNIGIIEEATYVQLERNILKFTAGWYWTVRCDPKYTFSFENHEKIIEEKCGVKGLLRYKVYLVLEFIKRFLKSLVHRTIGRMKHR